MKSWKHMTEKEFNKIKQLHELGITPANIVKITGRSTGTIWRIKKTDSFEAYKKPVRKETPVKSPSSESPKEKKSVGDLSDLQKQLNTQNRTLATILDVQSTMLDLLRMIYHK